MMLHRRWLLLSPPLIVFLLFLPALDFGFVWDDSLFITDLSPSREPAQWLDAMRQPLSPNYFRPVGVFSFLVELRLWGANSSLFHLTSILLHAFNALLVAILARHLAHPEMDGTKRTWLQVGAALLYGLHPALLEGVAFIAAWTDPLVSALLLTALLADLRISHPVLRAFSVALAFLLAVLGKEMALAFVVVLPLWHLARRQRPLFPLADLWRDLRTSGDLAVYAALLLATALLLALRFAALGYLVHPRAQATIPTGDALQHLLLIARSGLRYFVLVIWPFTNLTPIHFSPLPISSADLTAWVALLILLASLAGLLWLVRRAPRSGWLACAAALSLLPVINIFPLELDGGAFVAERYLVFPLALLILALVPLIRPWPAWNTRFGHVPLWLFPLLWLLLCTATIQRTLPHWRDDVALWSWGAARAPASSLPPTNLSLAFIQQGSYEPALAAADRALSLDPSRANAWNNLGLALYFQGDWPSAQAAFEEAVRLDEDNAGFWNNLAAALREQDRLQDAEQVLLQQVLPRDPSLPLAHLNLGMIYQRLDRPDLAAQHLQEVLRLSPPEQSAEATALLAELEEPGIWLRFGDNLLANGDFEGALAAFDQASVFGAQPVDVVVGTAAALTELDALTDAEQLVGQALQQAPNDARLYNILGVIALKRGELETAAQSFNRAMTLAPDWDVPRQNLEALPSVSP
jgi:tetratricopeptide (TPR) repeat protein